MTDKISMNYVVAHYWDEEPQRLGAYMAYNSEVQFGTLEDAKEFLKYVRRQSPGHKWRLFQLVSVMEDIDDK
jgi:hypothetical protein